MYSAIPIEAKPRARLPLRNIPLVSAIIPVYNAARFIRDCLDSVLAQSGPFALDVIVVDDGSTDDSLAEVRGDAGVRCVEQPNRGPAAARNTALRLAQGDYLAFLDSDDLWPEGKLARQIALLEAHPEIGLVFGDCRQFEAQGDYAQTLFESAGYDSAFWGDPVEVVAPYAKLIGGNFITTGSVVMRRACMEQVGEFDEELRLVEDLDYWFRVALACPMAHLDSVCLLRRRHPENTSRDPIAMTLAYLRMLDAHRRREADRVRPHAAALRSRMTREFQELGHLYSRQGAHGDAVRAYLRALSGKVSLRSVYYLASALAARAGLTRGAAR